VASFSLADEPRRDELLERASLHVLDAVGVALAASAMEDGIAEPLRRYVGGYGSRGCSQLIGVRDRAAAPLAAFFNGSLVHACEFDDTGYERVVHTEAFAVPAVLAIGEERGSSGLELAEAWCVATEVALRLARACDDRHGLWRSGFHNTAVFGCFGAAAGAAKLLGLEAEQTANALALATSYASGTNAGWGEASGRNKSVQPGWAALAGLHAALLAAEGYDCAHDTLDGPMGLFASHAWRGEWTLSRVTDRLGEDWALLQLTFKLHAAGAMIQSTLDALRRILVDHAVAPEEVERIRVVVPAQYQPMVERWHDASYRPDSPYGIGFSWPCSSACMLLYGRVGPEHQRWDVLRDPRFLALVDRVDFAADADASLPEEEQVAFVSVETPRGTFEAQQARHLGYFGPGTSERVKDKFRVNARLVLDAERVAELEAAILGLEAATAGALARLLGDDR